MGRKKVARKAAGLNLAQLSVSQLKQALATKEKRSSGKLAKLEAKRGKIQAQLDKVLQAIADLGGEVKPATGKKRGRPTKVGKAKRLGRPAKVAAKKVSAPKPRKAKKAKKQTGVAEAVVAILAEGGAKPVKDIDQGLRDRGIVVNALGTYLSKLVSGSKIARAGRGQYAAV